MEDTALIKSNDIYNDIYMEKTFLEETEQTGEIPGLPFSLAEQIVDQMIEYKKLRMMYSCALKEVRTKFDVLNTEFSVRYQRNPINFITMRVKSTNSIVEKMRRQNCEFTMKNLEDRIRDIAGLRVICSYVDDIYRLAQALTEQDDIYLIEEKDYIAHPKPNGYRSLHLIVSVPVFFTDQKKDMKVEVQIRTIAMDFWATLEHEIKYKKDVPNQMEIIEQLKTCADTIAATDLTMLDIRRQMEGRSTDENQDMPEIQSLLKKLSRLDEPIP